MQEASLPVYLYNFPANTGGLITEDLFKKLTQRFPQLKGIKNTFDDMPLQKKFKAATPDKQVSFHCLHHQNSACGRKSC